jgi:hypothetical protein
MNVKSKNKTKKNLSVVSAIVFLVFIASIYGVSAVGTGTGITPDITTQKFAPKVWFCGERVVYDDNIEPGRNSSGGEELIERINNYAFEGEQIKWSVLVYDKNGLENINDVYVSLGDLEGAGNPIEANCELDSILTPETEIPSSCNARLSSEEITSFVSDTAAFYTCTFTVETPENIYGQYWTTVEADDNDGMSGTMDENEYWFFNPVIALSIQGDMIFNDVMPGTSAYSDTLLVGNDADRSSGVILDMFISGTDFYDSSSSGARCPETNQLALGNFRYYATKGAYSTQGDLGVGRDARVKDAEGYIGIGYGNTFSPSQYYNHYEILQAAQLGDYYSANLLSPGSEIAITFRLNMPEPCSGNFDTGKIYFWGEAV